VQSKPLPAANAELALVEPWLNVEFFTACQLTNPGEFPALDCTTTTKSPALKPTLFDERARFGLAAPMLLVGCAPQPVKKPVTAPQSDDACEEQ